MNEKSFRTKFTMNYTPCGMYDHRIDGEIGMWSTLTPNLDRICGLIGYMIHFLWKKPCTIYPAWSVRTLGARAPLILTLGIVNNGLFLSSKERPKKCLRSLASACANGWTSHSPQQRESRSPFLATVATAAAAAWRRSCCRRRNAKTVQSKTFSRNSSDLFVYILGLYPFHLWLISKSTIWVVQSGRIFSVLKLQVWCYARRE